MKKLWWITSTEHGEHQVYLLYFDVYIFDDVKTDLAFQGLMCYATFKVRKFELLYKINACLQRNYRLH